MGARRSRLPRKRQPPSGGGVQELSRLTRRKAKRLRCESHRLDAVQALQQADIARRRLWPLAAATCRIRRVPTVRNRTALPCLRSHRFPCRSRGAESAVRGRRLGALGRSLASATTQGNVRRRIRESGFRSGRKAVASGLVAGGGEQATGKLGRAKAGPAAPPLVRPNEADCPSRQRV